MANNNHTDNQNNSVSDIVAQYSPQLLSYIRHTVGDEVQAEDVLQDVFYQLARNYYSGIEKVESWLFRVAKNTIYNLWRKKKDEPLSYITDDEGDILACEEIANVILSPESETPESDYMRQLVWQELDIALSELPPSQREVFEMTVFDGMTIKDISQTTGVNMATLLSRKHYAVKYLRVRLRSLYEDFLS